MWWLSGLNLKKSLAMKIPWEQAVSLSFVLNNSSFWREEPSQWGNNIPVHFWLFFIKSTTGTPSLLCTGTGVGVWFFLKKELFAFRSPWGLLSRSTSTWWPPASSTPTLWHSSHSSCPGHIFFILGVVLMKGTVQWDFYLKILFINWTHWTAYR